MRRVKDHQLEHATLHQQIVEDRGDDAGAAVGWEFTKRQSGAGQRGDRTGEICERIDEVGGVRDCQLAAQDVQARPDGVDIVDGHRRRLSGSEKPFPKARGKQGRRQGWVGVGAVTRLGAVEHRRSDVPQRLAHDRDRGAGGGIRLFQLAERGRQRLDAVAAREGRSN